MIIDTNLNDKKFTKGPLLKNLIQKRIDPKGKLHELPKVDILWSSESLGFNHSIYFNQFSPQEKELLLRDLSQHLLSEAYFIEMAGMNYGAKMNLMAQTFEEKQFYCHFSADEAKHFEYLSRLCEDFITPSSNNPFLSLLFNIIEKGSRSSLIFLVQVLLEGWGLEHYRFLSSNCLCPYRTEYFNDILKDEGGHHGGGVLLFEEENLSSADYDFIQEYGGMLLQMVQFGPQNLLKSFSSYLPSFSEYDREKFLIENQSVRHTQSQLEFIKKLFKKAKANKTVANFERRGLFKALPLKEMAWNSLSH